MPLAAELASGLEERAQVATLEPGVHFIEEFPLKLRQRLSAEQLRKAAKIVHVRLRIEVSGRVSPDLITCTRIRPCPSGTTSASTRQMCAMRSAVRTS